MKYQGREINDECSRCGNIFECVLFLKGHGIGTEREHVADMLRCQFEHKERHDETDKRTKTIVLQT